MKRMYLLFILIVLLFLSSCGRNDPPGNTLPPELEGSILSSINGGTITMLDNELFPAAITAESGTNLLCPGTQLGITTEENNTILLSLAVKGQSVCSEIEITIRFEDADTVMTYYAPVQWSRIYMPMKCSGALKEIQISIKSGSILLGEVTAENKGQANIDSLNLKSGMWMLDEFEDIVIDSDNGILYQNNSLYEQNEKLTGTTVDLVSSSCGRYLYSIGGGHLTITDISDTKNPKVCSVYSNPEYPSNYGTTRQIALIPGGGKNGDAIIFTSRISGAFIIDVSDPKAPVELSHYDALEMATGIAVSDKYAFIANRQYGVEVVDISDLSNPKHISVIARGTEVQSCKVVNGIMYCGLYDTNRVSMYDVSDVTNPVYLGAANLNGKGDGMTVAVIDGKTYLYAGTGHHTITKFETKTLANLNYGQGNGLDIFDVTDPANPILLSVSKIDGRFCHSSCDYWGAEIAEHDGKYYAYLTSTYNGVYVYDVTDPKAPIRLAHITVGVKPDSRFFSSLGHTSASYPVIFQYDHFMYKQAPIGAIAVENGALYLAGVFTDLYSCEADWCYSTIKSEGTPLNASGDYYADDSFTFVRPGGQAYAIAEFGDKIYVASGSQGIDIWSKDLKTHYKTIPVLDICYDLYIQNGLLYSAEGRNGLVVYSISADGLTLTQEKHYISTNDLITMVRPSATGKFAALHVGNTSGEIVNLEYENPVCVTKCPTRTQAYHHNVALAGNGRYVVFWGLSGNEMWFDFGENDVYASPMQLPICPFKSMASLSGGYTDYKDDIVIMTRSNGYIYYRPTVDSDLDIIAKAQNGLIRPLSGYGSTEKASIYGKGYVYENLLISCDRVYGRIFITDISDIDHPVLLKSYTDLKGHPDICTVIDGTLYVPMGYHGIATLSLAEYIKAP